MVQLITATYFLLTTGRNTIFMKTRQTIYNVACVGKIVLSKVRFVKSTPDIKKKILVTVCCYSLESLGVPLGQERREPPVSEDGDAGAEVVAVLERLQA